MRKGTIWTILGVVVAVIIAWIVVDIALKAIFLVGKLLLVAVVALIVFFVLRSLFSRRDA
ncbi:hypothetical protein ACIQLK_05305 [Microbacterium sp. NPDC091382]|uniref:Flagellar biosynthesis protein FlhA n=1 Tax=Microbacterium aquilitoris TaxID=3067307 RepID=A0ABU3GGY0_9MICO|nr:MULTISPECIES: hypothetical protein [unclassified Microbacterium]MDT3329965.1 hypothetical protein [Microbacterium sp. KSW-18]MDT3345798.1 hypothetical protein [Microbacterium sp. KSW2-22]SDG90530.1 hypothetical protein SAMN04488590_2175 [Microbacterium sp. 77mftsu3.1]